MQLYSCFIKEHVQELDILTWDVCYKLLYLLYGFSWDDTN